jgi:hypothetical protein
MICIEGPGLLCQPVAKGVIAEEAHKADGAVEAL